MLQSSLQSSEHGDKKKISSFQQYELDDEDREEDGVDEDKDGKDGKEDEEMNVDNIAKIFAQTNKFSMRDIDMYL